MNLPRPSLPSARSLLSRLPPLPPALALTAALNLGEQLLLRQADLSALLGKRFQLDVIDLGLALHFERRRFGFVPCRRTASPDLRIAASAADFWQLLRRQEDPDTLFFNRRLLLEGDTDLGLLVKNLLDAIEWPEISRQAPGNH